MPSRLQQTELSKSLSYEAVFENSKTLIAIMQNEKIIKTNNAMRSFFAQLCDDMLADEFYMGSFFEPVNHFGYIYDGFNALSWFEYAIRNPEHDHRVGIIKDSKLFTFALSLREIDVKNSLYTLELNDLTDIVGYKNSLENEIKVSTKENEKAQFLLSQYDKAMTTSTLVYRCSLDGYITYANDAMTKVMLYPRGSLVGKHASILYPPDMTQEQKDVIWGKLLKGKVYHGPIYGVDRMGEIHYFDATIVPIFDTNGIVVEYLSLRHETTELVEAKEMALKTLAAKDKFFNQASHELRTPLNSIINFIDSALESFDEAFSDEDTKELMRIYLQRSYSNSKHLLKLITSLLDMAKARAGKEIYEMIASDICELAQEVYNQSLSLCANDSVEFLLHAPSEPIIIAYDSLKMRQIMLNLISNALKFTHKGCVCLTVKDEKKECIIEVKDSGVGIPAEKLGVIFEPFEQVSTQDQGTGLGLGIVHEYIKGMGMKLDVESEVSKGTLFKIRIPKDKK